MTSIEKAISIFGITVELTRSQSQNFIIITNHWKNFNHQLKQNQFNQISENWCKYGVTFKIGERYFYLAAIPWKGQNLPDNFIKKEIPKGEYAVFFHKGAMENIKNTIHSIYKEILPTSNLSLKQTPQTGFMHFEKYDYRFQWNKSDSIVAIWVPIITE
jgi:predicted transcriptional regulator YdeE